MIIITKERAAQLNPLVLAFVGDGVFTLYTRQFLAANSDAKANLLNKQANKIVNATAQSAVYDKMSEFFTEEESDIARRARNQHTANVAKNASLADYKRATALEAVIGFLHLSGNAARIEELFSLSGILTASLSTL